MVANGEDQRDLIYKWCFSTKWSPVKNVANSKNKDVAQVWPEKKMVVALNLK